MRIRELDIETFGVFRDRQMRFDPGLQIIYGPNEAGKTTLLQLVRQLLFGFPHRNPYSLQDHAGPLCAKAKVEMQDGQQLWFRRRKGRPDRVVGELESNRDVIEVDDRLLTAMLGNATAQLYDNVFGFSLDELAQGTASLREANLTDALYGSGVGSIANIQHVRTDLENDAKRLFNPRSKKSEIMQLLARLHADEQTWRMSQVSPRQHREMLADQVNADQAADRLKAQLDEHRKDSASRRTLLEALPAYQQWREASSQLRALPPAADGLEVDTPARYERLQKDVVAVDQTAAELKATLASVEAQQKQLPPDGAFAGEADAIQKLHQQVGRLQNDQELLPRKRQEAETIRENVIRELQSIHPEWTTDSLSQLQAGADQREAVQRLSERKAKVDRKRTQLRAQLKELRRQEERWRGIVEMPASEVERIVAAEKLMQQLHQYRADCERREEQSTQLAAMEKQHQGQLDELSQLEAWDKRALPSPPPSRDAIQKHEQQFAELERQTSERRQASAHQRQQHDAYQLRLDALEDADAPTESQLREARGERDAALERLQSGAETLPSGDAWTNARRLIERVDSLTDEMLQAADIVAQRTQLQQQLDNALVELRRREEQLAESEAGLAKAQAEWTSLWTACELQPAAPARMLAWRDAYVDWSESSESLLRLQSRVSALATRLQGYESAWRDLLDGLAFSTDAADAGQLETQPVDAGARWFAEQQDALQHRDVAAKEIESVAQRVAQTRQDLEAVESDDEAWAAEWAKLLGQLGFPPHWEPSLIQRVFQSLADASSRLRQAATLSKAAQEIANSLAQAESAVAALVERLAITLPKMPVDAAIAHLYESLEDERRGQRRKHELEMQREAAQRRLQRSLDDRAKLDSQLDAIRKAIDATDGEELKKRLEAVNQRKALESKANVAHSRLVAAAARMELPDVALLEQQLEELNADELAKEIESDRVRTKELEAELEQVQRRAGAATAALDQLTESTAATDAARELAAGRARLGQVVDRWAPLAMANQLLAMSMERFEKVNQPALLQETSRLYEQLTRGRYVKVFRKLDDHQSLAVEDTHGNVKTSNELSTGAREQLYLAIRLAYVGEYCRRAEPLPIVMDDVLVNFDDDRAASALTTLQNCSANQQVLFLTCHQRVVDLASSLSIPTIAMQVREAAPQPRRKTRRRKPPVPPRLSANPNEPDGPTQQDLFPRG